MLVMMQWMYSISDLIYSKVNHMAAHEGSMLRTEEKIVTECTSRPGVISI